MTKLVSSQGCKNDSRNVIQKMDRLGVRKHKITLIAVKKGFDQNIFKSS